MCLSYLKTASLLHRSPFSHRSQLIPLLYDLQGLPASSTSLIVCYSHRPPKTLAVTDLPHFKRMLCLIWDVNKRIRPSNFRCSFPLCSRFHKVAKMFNILNPNIQVKRTPGKKSTKIATSDFWQDVRA
ncbi:hypothetical protein L2E82_16864 [Cichorium intybus]|uniref:Uncharacterized protein n=1 Tax=Cichorium intybus TaxID=13427 RepID=A0ACB9F6P2_CICIN|nr:hypothetical protein L2E82_16864 [Cichorium intybus]